ncbi:restriction endonuclease subunit S [Blastopirellula sp. JC732]|uniref:Restriction endonuclease subunit S n=1 Tax=Blastopirellula sediminis TaxID=2894196 RepID=A0A9X1SI51_9BACT|nr:restriction endonuclease subunit S [Blastopirellula sediminis]MCC9606226.1 restriction endonuclease subunit S [Blastopirellula sediminis]MCC9630476.1 restriction endonuclease subunit S [Blastopirellula sediminis]
MFRTEWPVARLSQLLTDVQPGFARDPGDGDVGIAQLRTNNVDRNGELSLETVKRVDASEAELTKYSVTPGDVIFNNTNSPELVGKTAFFDLDGDWVLSNHMTRLRVNPEVVDPKFLARVLHFYWGMGFSGRRGKQWVNQAAVDARALSTFPIPLPTLSEQRRIVETLDEARDIRQLRQQAYGLTADLIPAIFHDMFGEELSEVQYVRLGAITSEIQYGTSTASAETGYTTLRIPNVVGDTVSYDELVTVPLSEAEAKKYFLSDHDMLFVRTNGNPEYVGRSAVFNRQLANEAGLNEQEVIFASYLIRLRLKEDSFEPEFVASYLRTPIGRRDVMRQSKTSAGQFNINTQGLKGLAIPAVPRDRQLRFIEVVREIDDLKRSLMYESQCIDLKLNRSLLAHAFSGELTAEWREANRELLEQEAAKRDKWLHEAGVKLTVADTKIEVKAKDQDDRHEDLNREQHELLRQIQSLELDASAGTFTLSTLTDSLVEPLDKLSVATVRRHLDVLTARGLVKSISRRAGAGGSIDVAFGNAYRLPKNNKQAVKTDSEADEVRMTELDRMSRQGRVFHETLTDQLTLSEKIAATSERLSAGNLAPVSGLYQEIGPDGELGKTVSIEKGKSLPPPSLEGGVYVKKGDE